MLTNEILILSITFLSNNEMLNLSIKYIFLKLFEHLDLQTLPLQFEATENDTSLSTFCLDSYYGLVC